MRWKSSLAGLALLCIPAEAAFVMKPTVVDCSKLEQFTDGYVLERLPNRLYGPDPHKVVVFPTRAQAEKTERFIEESLKGQPLQFDYKVVQLSKKFFERYRC